MKLKEKLNEAIARQQAILDGAKAAGNRKLTEDETRSFGDVQKEIDEIKAKIADEEKSAGTGTDPSNAGEAAQKAVTGERQRIADVTELCRNFDMDPNDYIMKGTNIENVRAAVLERLKDHGAPISVKVTADETDKFRSAAADAMLMRAGVSVEKPAAGATDLRGMGLRDLAIECLVREGQNANVLLRKDKGSLYDELARGFFNPTAAFPSILDDAIRKNIVHVYQTVPTTFDRWTSKGSVTDFKPTPDHSYLIGGAGDFLLVPENGELKHDKPSTELLPQRKIDTYGRQFSMSRQAFINDDIGFITEIPGIYATSAKRTIDKQVYKILFNNPAIYDGGAFFSDTHKNLIASGAAPSVATIQSIILQMQKQKDPFGDAIYIVPEFLIVPVGYKFALKVAFESSQMPGSPNNDVNPLYKESITTIETPVLNALAGANAAPWFCVANRSSAKSIQVDYLNGQETPTIRRSEAPGQLGFVWDIYLDWGVTVVDYRGVAKNPGAVIS